MIIEFLDKVLVDKAPIVENVRLNLKPEKRQLRLKLTHLKGGNKTPIDIVIFNYSPSIEMLNVALILDGKELNTSNNFRLKLSYDILKRKFKMSGNVTGKEVNYMASNIKDLLYITSDFISIFHGIENK